jgi:hypothetical protein
MRYITASGDNLGVGPPPVVRRSPRPLVICKNAASLSGKLTHGAVLPVLRAYLSVAGVADAIEVRAPGFIPAVVRSAAIRRA